MGLKKFFKKNLRDIATVVGFAVGGPAGAAIGQGVGSLGEGRSLKKSLVSSAKVYGGANLAAGAGITPETITPAKPIIGFTAMLATLIHITLSRIPPVMLSTSLLAILLANLTFVPNGSPC